MADYSKMKNAELETLLKDRNLPHTGKKADLVKRLQESDAKPDTAAASKTLEDEIDWDDEPATTAAANATSEPAAAAILAGGQGEVGNPQAVPNQVPDIDPATTDDLTVSAPNEAATGAEPAKESAPVEREKTPVDFSSGLAKTTLDQEIEKRKARAKKFGLDESTDETLKELERAKKFGASDMPGKLNEALPERREKKRGREAGEEAADVRKRGRADRPGRGGRPDLGGRRGSGRKDNVERASAPRANTGSGPGWMNEAEKAKAEARKAKWSS